MTLCKTNKEKYSGVFIGGEMDLSEFGAIFPEEWLQTAIIRSNITIDEWTIMPDHIHGILVIAERMPIIITRASLQAQNGNPEFWVPSLINIQETNPLCRDNCVRLAASIP